MGTVTHGSVQAIDVNARFQRVNGEQNLDLSVYKYGNGEYLLYLCKRKLKSFRNAKTLVNLYPKNKQENVKEFVDINNVNFKNSKKY